MMLTERDLDELELLADAYVEAMMQDFERLWKGQRVNYGETLRDQMGRRLDSNFREVQDQPYGISPDE